MAADEDGPDRDSFFAREENPFKEIDEQRQAPIVDGDDELETNDVQFKALKQDVLLRMFDPGLEEDHSFPASANLFVIGNRIGWFACGCQNCLIFGRTEVLRTAFEEAKPKSTAILKDAQRFELSETPTHVCFSGNNEFLVLALPQAGILVLNCALLQQQKPLTEATISSEKAASILTVIANPSPRRSPQIAYITRQHPKSPFGCLYLYDIVTRKAERLDSQQQFTCITYSHSGDILMAGTRSGEVMYYHLDFPNSVPIRRPPPTDLPDLEADSWWTIQAMYWLDAQHQLVFYNPLVHPSDPPEHQYQTYIISNPENRSSLTAFNFKYVKFAIPPVDAFGNTSLAPWFYFASLHAWNPNIKSLALCCVTAGSDIGLVGCERESPNWRIWSIADESRRPTVPYDMEKNQETICVGMQLDFTATKRLEKPLYPDEVPGECEALPVLWVLNTAGQLAGWTVIYKAGVKAGERPLGMKGFDVQEKYWALERDKMVDQIDEKEMKDRELWQKEWRKSVRADVTQGAAPALTRPQEVTITPAPATTEPARAPKQVASAPRAKEPSPVSLPQQTTATPTESPRTLQQHASPAAPSVSIFDKPVPFSGSGFGRPSQLGGSIPGQSGMYPGFTSTTTQSTRVFGQPAALGTSSTSSPSHAGVGSGFAKYSAASQAASGFLGAAGRTGSFLQGTTSGSSSFLQGATTAASPFLQGVAGGSSFLSSTGQPSTSTKSEPDHGFAKFAATRTPDSMTTPSSFSTEGKGLLDARVASSIRSPFGESLQPSPTQRTQQDARLSSRTHSFDVIDDSTTESETSEEDQSDSDDGAAMPAQPLNLGADGFNLSLGGSVSRRQAGQLSTPAKAEARKEVLPNLSPSAESVSSVGEEYVKVSIPITPSPQRAEAGSTAQVTKNIAQPTSEKPRTIIQAPAGTKGPSAQTAPALPLPRVAETAGMPAGTVVVKAQPQKSTILPSLPRWPSPQKPPPVEAIKQSTGRTPTPSSNKVEIRPIAPAPPSMAVSSNVPKTNELSDAFRLVVEQVSRELVKLSENAQALADYISRESHNSGEKTELSLSTLDEWTFADLNTMTQIVEKNTTTVESIIESLPPIEVVIQEIEKSLKKMEAKKMELSRVVQAVQDPEVRESIHSRKLAPDFARQQREIRHALQTAEEKLKALASDVTILKAGLADDKASFGVHAPTSAGIYRVVNNVFSRLQILSTKVSNLEKRAGHVRELRGNVPSPESLHSRSSVVPTTPITKSGYVARSSPKVRTSGMSPRVRGSLLGKTMLDEKVDPWEMEEIIRDLERRETLRGKIEGYLRGSKPLYAEASSL